MAVLVFPAAFPTLAAGRFTVQWFKRPAQPLGRRDNALPSSARILLTILDGTVNI